MKRIISLILSVWMVLSLLPISAFAETTEMPTVPDSGSEQIINSGADETETETESLTVTKFAALDEEPITVDFGTDKESVPLPKTLLCEAEGNEGSVEIDANWVCESYDGNIAGDYLFVSCSDIHKTSEDVQWPSITVTVMPEKNCICKTPCDSEDIYENCPVCSADGADLTLCMKDDESTLSLETSDEILQFYGSAPEDKSSTTWDGKFPSPDSKFTFSGGSGTAEDPYLISTAADFVQLAVNVNDTTGSNFYSEKNLKLTADINLDGHAWAPIGKNYIYCFNGTLDGDGYTISGLNVETAVEYDNVKYAGLFAYIKINGTIKNLTVSGSVNVSNAEKGKTLSAGLLVGTNNGGMIDGCASIGTVNATATDSEGPVFAGGLIGDSRKSTANPTNLLNSASSADVTVHANNGRARYKGYDIGSMAGGLVGSLSGNIKNCFATGNVSGTKLGKDREVGGGAGGLVGAAMDYSEITDSYATGSVTVAETNSGAGGLVGALIILSSYRYNVERCYATGAVDASGATANAGGIVGFNENNNIKNCVALNSSVKGGGNIGRISYTGSGSNVSANYARADMTIGISGFAAKSEESPMVLSDERDIGPNGASVSGAAWGTWFNGGNVWNKEDATGFAVGASLPKLTDMPATIPQNPTLPAAGSVDEPVELTEDTVVVKYGRYTISSLDELQRLTGVCCSATLAQDIVLTGDWTPVNTAVNTGSLALFDGGGHSITGLDVTSATDYYAGLFANASKTVIRDLRVAGSVNVSSEKKLYVGGIAGLVKRIENCVSEVNVTASGSKEMHAGSLAGSGMAKNCYATGDVYTKYTGSDFLDFMTGGLIGDTKGVKYCYATGEVTAEAANNTNAYTGGITGQVKAYSVSDPQTYLGNSVALCPTVSGNKATKRMGNYESKMSDNDAWFYGLKARKNMFVNGAQPYGTIMDAQGLDVSVKSADDSGALLSFVFKDWDSNVWAISEEELSVGVALPTLKSITATQTPTLKAMPAPKIIIGPQKTALVYGTAGTADYDVNPMYLGSSPLYTVNWESGTAPTEVTVRENINKILIFATTDQTPRGVYSFTLSSGGATSAVATLTVGKGTYSPTTKTVYIRAAGAAGTVTAATLGFTMDGAKIKAIKTVPTHVVLSEDATLSEGTLNYSAKSTFTNGKSESYVLTVESEDYADFDVTVIFKMAVEDRKLNFKNGADGWGLYVNDSTEKYEGEGITWSVVENGYTDGSSQYPLLKLNNFAFSTSAEKAMSIDASCAVELTGTNAVTSTYSGEKDSRGVSIGTAVENVFFIGTGTINISSGTSTSNSRGIDNWGKSLNFYGCTVNAVGGSAPKSYGIYSNNNITIGEGAYVTGRATATEGTDHNAYGIYEYYGILNVSDGTLIGEAMAGTNKFGIAFSSLAQQDRTLHFRGDTGSGYNIVGRASTSKSGGVYLIVDSSKAAFAKAKISSYNRNTALEITADTETADELATEGWKWNKDTKTLTIDGLDLVFDGSSDSEEINAIKLPLDATLEVKGTNTVTVSNRGANGAVGICSAGALNVKGTGSLTATATSSLTGTALCARGNMTVEDATLVLSGIGGEGSYGVASVGSVTINSGSVEANGSTFGIRAMMNATSGSGKVTINGGQVTACGGTYAIFSQTDSGIIITVADGATIKTSENKNDSGATETTNPDYSKAKYVSVSFIPKVTFYYKNDSQTNTVTVPASKSKEGTYTVSLPYNKPEWGNYTFEGWYNSADDTFWASKGSMPITESLNVYAKWTMDGFAVRTDPLILEDMESGSGDGWEWNKGTKTLTINDLNMDVIGSSDSEGINAIMLPAGATLEVSGTNTITVSNSGKNGAVGIYGAGALNVKGTGTLTVTATGSKWAGVAIFAFDDITIEEATLVLNGKGEGSEGVFSSGDITINSGSVKADGDICGIHATANANGEGGSIAINGGNVTAGGGTCAIYSLTGSGSIINIADGAIIKTSESKNGDGAAETSSPNYGTAKYISVSFGPGFTVSGNSSFEYSSSRNPQEFTITAVNWDSAPEFVTVSLKDGNAVEWSDDGVPLDYDGTVTIRVNVGYLPVKASGSYTIEVSAENGYDTVIGRTNFTITRARHDNVLLYASAVFNKAADNITYTLPILPTGAASYQTPEIKTGDNADGLLKSEPLSVNGRTLSYSVNAVDKGKTAVITVTVPQSTNYNSYNVLVTVTATGYSQAWADDVFGKTGWISNATYINIGTASEPEHKIKLNNDVTLNDTLELDEDFTIDLNGKKINGADGKDAIKVSGSGTSLTITDTSSGSNGTITGGTGADGITVADGASADISGGATVNGGSSTGSAGGNGIDASGSGTVNVSGGTINGGNGTVGGNGIKAESGDVTITGNVTGGNGTSGVGGNGITATTGDVTVNSSDSTVTGGSSTGSTGGNGIDASGNGIVNVNGGTINGGNGTIGGNGIKAESGDVTITGNVTGGNGTSGVGGNGITASTGNVNVNSSDSTVTGGNGGDDSAGGNGIDAAGSGTVNVGGGTINGGNGTDGGNGIKAENGAVTITGNVTGGNGTSGVGGNGITATTGDVTVNSSDSTVTGGSSTGSAGGNGIDAAGSGTVNVSGGTINGGNGTDGGNGIKAENGAVTITGNVTGGNGTSGVGGNGITATTGNVTVNSSDSRVTGGNGGTDGENGGDGGRGVTTTTGDITVDGSISGGNGASGTISTGTGGSGAQSDSGDISVNKNGNIIGGNGGTDVENGENGGNGGRGVTTTTGDITVDGSISGGNGGNGGTNASFGGNGGNGGTGASAAGTITINGIVSGGNGGDSGTDAANGGNGGTGADTTGAIIGTGTAVGGIGGNIPDGGQGKEGTGGKAIADEATFTEGTKINGKKGIKIKLDITEPVGTDSINVPTDKIVEAAVTEQEREQADSDGETITVSLSITPSDKTAGQAAIEKTLKAENAAVIYIEVKLEKIITPSVGNEVKTTITDANSLISFEIVLSPDYQNKEHYAIMREHGGEVDMLTSVPNTDGEYISVNEAKTIVTVFAKHFSTYALVCSETVISQNSPEPSQSGSNNQNHPSVPIVIESPANPAETPAEQAAKPSDTDGEAGNKPDTENPGTEPKNDGSSDTSGDKPDEEEPTLPENDNPAEDEIIPDESIKDDTVHIPFYIWIIILAAAAFIVILIMLWRKKD